MNAVYRFFHPPGLSSRARIAGIRFRSLAYRLLVLPWIRPRGRVCRPSRGCHNAGARTGVQPGEEPFYSRRFRFERECSKFLHHRLPR